MHPLLETKPATGKGAEEGSANERDTSIPTTHARSAPSAQPVDLAESLGPAGAGALLARRLGAGVAVGRLPLPRGVGRAQRPWQAAKQPTGAPASAGRPGWRRRRRQIQCGAATVSNGGLTAVSMGEQTILYRYKNGAVV